MSNQRLDYILQMLKTEPNDSFLRYALSLEYAKLNELEKAIETIEALLKDDSNYVGAYYQLGKLYEQIGNAPLAIDTYKKGIIIAQQQNNRKTLGELNEALLSIEDD
ncbi:MAG: tetratricopeptide repeat protein [Bacteroidia bacterium]